MKNSILVLLIFTWSFCLGQNENGKDNLQLNHLLDAVETEVLIDFGDGLKKETRFKIDCRQILDYSFRIDTTVSQGIKELAIKIPLECPANVRIHTGDQMDHLFLVPGQNIHAVYNPLNSNLERIVVIYPESARLIDQYYDVLFDQFQISSWRLSAYQAFQGLMDPLDKIAGYDSLAFHQNRLLAKYSGQLPEWFMEYEWKSIKYMTSLFSANAIHRTNYLDQKQTLNEFPSSLYDTPLDDTIG